jgi:hypothetical protein
MAVSLFEAGAQQRLSVIGAWFCRLIKVMWG